MVTERYSVGHVFRKQTCGHHKCSPLTSSDVRLHTTTSSTTFAVTANIQTIVDIEKSFEEEKYCNILAEENSMLNLWVVNKTLIKFTVTIRRICKEYVLFTNSDMSHRES